MGRNNRWPGRLLAVLVIALVGAILALRVDGRTAELLLAALLMALVGMLR